MLNDLCAEDRTELEQDQEVLFGCKYYNLFDPICPQLSPNPTVARFD